MLRASSSQCLEPLRQVKTDVLDIGYYEAGPAASIGATST
jgi:hypothetical protein